MSADVIVVGGGIVGLWTACHLVTQYKVKTILFEQFDYFHTKGSSHGKSRIFKYSFSVEGYTAWALESYKKWKNLERIAGNDISESMDNLNIFDIRKGSTEACDLEIDHLRKYGIQHDLIDSQNIENLFPGLLIGEDYKCSFEPNGLLLKPEKCLTALRNVFKKHGGLLHDCEAVISIHPRSSTTVEVKTVKDIYTCRSVVLTCGSYINNILTSVGYQIPVTPTRAFVFYWKDKSMGNYSLKNGFPSTRIFINSSTYLYSIPSFEYPELVKICYHGGSVIDPVRQNDVTPKQQENETRSLQWLKDKIRFHFPDVDATSPAKKEACLITLSPDRKCIIDFHPKHRNIIFGAGFSGLGFMISPSIGRILASMATGTSLVSETEQFSMKRFDKSRL